MKDFIQDFKIEISIWVIAIITLIGVLYLFHTTSDCLEYRSERYYDTTGTAIAAGTRNYGMIALNGWRTRKVCIKYK